MEAVRAVLATGTTTQAAAVMGVTQSAVSRLVSQLEDDLGFALFDRRRGRLIATPEGLEFFQVADRILADIDRLRDTAAGIRAQGTRTLRIVAMPAIGVGMLPGPLTRLIAARGDVRIAVDLKSRGELEAAVAEGRYDLGLATLPVVHPGLAVEPLASVRAVLIAPPGHRFAGRDGISVADLDDEPMAALSTDTILRHRLEALCAAHGVRPRLVVEAQSTILIANMVARGLGVALVHPFVAEQYRGRVATAAFEPEIGISYGLVFPQAGPRLRLVEEVAAAIREAFAGLTAAERAGARS